MLSLNVYLLKLYMTVIIINNVIIILKPVSLAAMCRGGIRESLLGLLHLTGPGGPKQGGTRRGLRKGGQRKDTKAGENKVTKARGDEWFKEAGMRGQGKF